MNKLVIFKWASLLLSIGCITFFIVDDIYNDNRHVVTEVTIPEVEIEELKPAVEVKPVQVNVPTSCNDSINAYNSQVASNNGKISKAIEEKHSACTVEPVTQPTKVKDSKPMKKK